MIVAAVAGQLFDLPDHVQAGYLPAYLSGLTHTTQLCHPSVRPSALSCCKVLDTWPPSQIAQRAIYGPVKRSLYTIYPLNNCNCVFLLLMKFVIVVVNELCFLVTAQLVKLMS